MTPRTFLAAGSLFCLVACTKTETPAPEPPPSAAPTPAVATEAPSEAPTVVPEMTPEAEPSATPVAVVTPAPPRFAPAGVFYLTQPVSIMSDDGIRSLTPGTQVHMVSQDSTGTKVKTADGAETVVQPNQITNNLDIGERLAAQFSAGQRAGAQARAQAAASVAASQASAAQAAPAAPNPVEQSQQQQAPVSDMESHDGLGGAYGAKREMRATPPPAPRRRK